MRFTRPLLFAAFLAFTAVPRSAARAASCQLGVDADFPVTYVDGHIPVVTVKIQGQNIRLMVNTGAAITFLSPGAYNRLQLEQTDNALGYSGTGLGGSREISAFALVDINFGNIKVKDQVVGIFAKSTPDEIGPNAIDGTMGYDILQYFDIGLDLPHDRITLYTPLHCVITETPWQGDFAPIAFTRPHGGSPVIPETIDDQNFNVAIDTGADQSLIMQASLSRSGVTPEIAPVTLKGTDTGMAGLKFHVIKVRFSTLGIGAEVFSNAWLNLDTSKETELNQINDGLLGEDYLASHRVFISNSTNTAYLGLSGQ